MESLLSREEVIRVGYGEGGVGMYARNLSSQLGELSPSPLLRSDLDWASKLKDLEEVEDGCPSILSAGEGRIVTVRREGRDKESFFRTEGEIPLLGSGRILDVEVKKEGEEEYSVLVRDVVSGKDIVVEAERVREGERGFLFLDTVVCGGGGGDGKICSLSSGGKVSSLLARELLRIRGGEKMDARFSFRRARVEEGRSQIFPFDDAKMILFVERMEEGRRERVFFRNRVPYDENTIFKIEKEGEREKCFRNRSGKNEGKEKACPVPVPFFPVSRGEKKIVSFLREGLFFLVECRGEGSYLVRCCVSGEDETDVFFLKKVLEAKGGKGERRRARRVSEKEREVIDEEKRRRLGREDVEEEKKIPVSEVVSFSGPLVEKFSVCKQTETGTKREYDFLKERLSEQEVQSLLSSPSSSAFRKCMYGLLMSPFGEGGKTGGNFSVGGEVFSDRKMDGDDGVSSYLFGNEHPFSLSSSSLGRNEKEGEKGDSSDPHRSSTSMVEERRRKEGREREDSSSSPLKVMSRGNLHERDGLLTLQSYFKCKERFSSLRLESNSRRGKASLEGGEVISSIPDGVVRDEEGNCVFVVEVKTRGRLPEDRNLDRDTLDQVETQMKVWRKVCGGEMGAWVVSWTEFESMVSKVEWRGQVSEEEKSSVLPSPSTRLHVETTIVRSCKGRMDPSFSEEELKQGILSKDDSFLFLPSRDKLLTVFPSSSPFLVTPHILEKGADSYLSPLPGLPDKLVSKKDPSFLLSTTLPEESWDKVWTLSSLTPNKKLLRVSPSLVRKSSDRESLFRSYSTFSLLSPFFSVSFPSLLSKEYSSWKSKRRG